MIQAAKGPRDGKPPDVGTDAGNGEVHVARLREDYVAFGVLLKAVRPRACLHHGSSGAFECVLLERWLRRWRGMRRRRWRVWRRRWRGGRKRRRRTWRRRWSWRGRRRYALVVGKIHDAIDRRDGVRRVLRIPQSSDARNSLANGNKLDTCQQGVSQLGFSVCKRAA